MDVSPGDTFVGDPRQNGSQVPHMWVVVAIDASGMCAVAVMVNLTSTPVDESCILQVGDHPFVQHTSFAYYREAIKIEVTDIEVLVP